MELYIGTYTSGRSEGIYRALWRDEAIQIVGTAWSVNPSYLAVHGNMLYAVRETDGGSVASYRIGPESLTLTGEQPVHGDAPCHVCVVDDWLFVSNYSSGSLSIFPLTRDGTLASPPRVAKYEGCSVHERQRAPHAHQAQPTPDGTYLAVCDLGTDAVYFCPLEYGGIQLPGQRTFTPKGAGPRHAAFGNECWYVLCELTCDLLVYRGYGSGAELLWKHSALREANPEASAAALRLSPDGTLLLASVRGADTLVLWDVSPDGSLSGGRWFGAHGRCPRDAAFTPDGKYVLCACEQDDRVTAFAVRDGGLDFLHATEIPTPTCVCFASL